MLLWSVLVKEWSKEEWAEEGVEQLYSCQTDLIWARPPTPWELRRWKGSSNMSRLEQWGQAFMFGITLFTATNLNSSFKAEVKYFCVCELFLKTSIPSQIQFLPPLFFLYEPYRGIGRAHIYNIYYVLGAVLRTLHVHLQLIPLSALTYEETESQRN